MLRKTIVRMGCGAGLATLAACNSQMVTTSNFYAENQTPSLVAGEAAETNRETIRPVQGIPYYLPQSVIKLNVSGSQKSASDPASYTFSLKLTGVEQVADPSQMYLLEIHTEDATDDDITIGTNTKGLLESAKAISTDRSADILKKVAETAAAVMQAETDLFDANGKAISCNPPPPFSVDWTFPLDEAQMKEIKDGTVTFKTDAMAKAINDAVSEGINIRNPSIKIGLKLEVLDENKEFQARPSKWPSIDNPKHWAPGLRFRVPKIGALTITMDSTTTADFGSCKFAVHASINGERSLILDPTQDYVFDMSRTPLVKSSISLTVKDGILTSATVTKDSPALAAVKLPLDLLDILLAPISHLINGTPSTGTSSKAGG
nr:hypothetical protein [uncultured Dongia sp.]